MVCIFYHQLSSVLTAAAQEHVWTPAPAHALLCFSMVLLQLAVQKAASATEEMCLMEASACLTVGVGVFIMIYISR